MKKVALGEKYLDNIALLSGGENPELIVPDMLTMFVRSVLSQSVSVSSDMKAKNVIFMPFRGRVSHVLLSMYFEAFKYSIIQNMHKAFEESREQQEKDLEKRLKGKRQDETFQARRLEENRTNERFLAQLFDQRAIDAVCLGGSRHTLKVRVL